jgi:hypothetical protein
LTVNPGGWQKKKKGVNKKGFMKSAKGMLNGKMGTGGLQSGEIIYIYIKAQHVSKIENSI